jgi:hypothetical protein
MTTLLPEKTATQSILPARESFPKTTAFFEWGLYCIERAEELLWAGKYLLFGTGFFFSSSTS